MNLQPGAPRSEPPKGTSRRRPSPRPQELSFLLSNAFLRPLGDELLPLAQVSSVYSVSQGGPVFVAGEQADRVPLVLSGLLKVTQRSPDGSEFILGIFGPKELVGLLAALQRGVFNASALALSERARVLSIPSAALLDMATSNTAVALAINRALLWHNQQLHRAIDVLSAGSVPQRLATLLLTLAERFGDEMDDETTFIPVKFTRGELSSLINARSETTIRALSRWRRQGLVQLTGAGIILARPESLAAIASDNQTEHAIEG